MSAPFEIPADVVDYINSVFQNVNGRVSLAMANTPNVHEETLDFIFISTIAEFAAPVVLPSDFIVDINVHFLGGGRHYENWEIADLGVIVMYARGAEHLRTKVALLQSKRLYPREVDFVENEAVTKPGGFGWLALPSAFPAQHVRQFSFDGECRYSALQVGDGQWQRIAEYEERHRIPVHYLLYHPQRIPFRQIIPLAADRRVPEAAEVEFGARVVRSTDMRGATVGMSRNYAPSVGELGSRIAGSAPGEDIFGWPIDIFMSSEVLSCREGYIADDPASDDGLNAVFNLRSGPISAAFRISITAPA